MSSETIRKHLRAALEEVVSAEKARLYKIYDKTESDIADGIKMMGPIIEALNSLKAEIGEVEGLEVSPASLGHIAFIKLNFLGFRRSLSISTNTGNSKFQVEDTARSPLDEQDVIELHELSSAEEVLELFIDAVGKHIGSNQVFTERKK